MTATSRRHNIAVAGIAILVALGLLVAAGLGAFVTSQIGTRDRRVDRLAAIYETERAKVAETGGDPGPPAEVVARADVGPSGERGLTGPDGPRGTAGRDGERGLTGADSTVPGPRGADGVGGVQGGAGETGARGLTGETGDPGAASTVPGPAGDPGAQGPAGNDGATGPQGERGPAPEGIVVPDGRGGTCTARDRGDGVYECPAEVTRPD